MTNGIDPVAGSIDPTIGGVDLGPAMDRLILALDMPALAPALELVDSLEGRLRWVKVGLEMFSAEGPEAVRRLRQRGLNVFLDLKLHDIPNTVARAAEALLGLGVSMINLHAAGGQEMMAHTVTAVTRKAQELGVPRPKILAVTVLTSIDQVALNNEVGVPGTLEAQVEKWALEAKAAGCDGVVASPREVELVKRACGQYFLTVTPGVRPAGADVGDQRRTMPPAAAIAAGADYLVVGRPVTAADNPVAALSSILVEMEAAIHGR